MKNTNISRFLMAGLLTGIAVCTFLIVQNQRQLQNEVETQKVHFLNQLATKLVTERVAEFTVTQISAGLDGKSARCQLQWQERIHVDADGKEVFGTKTLIDVDGIQPRFEALIVEFSETDAKEALALGSGSLILFRRIYGENTAPSNGFSFADFNHPVPDIYATQDQPGSNEQETWRRFWQLATDPTSAEEEGLKVKQVSYSIATTLVPKGKYRVTAEAGGRLRIIELKP
ncbi:MAG: hypothetical protein ACI97A_000086 [Planctomycetota bacterium]|jgi:hypothetical protein